MYRQLMCGYQSSLCSSGAVNTKAVAAVLILLIDP